MKKPKEEKPVFKINAEVVLTEVELKAAGKALAEALNSQKRIQGELETFKAQKKAELTSIEATVERNTLLLNTGREFRMVECVWEYDWKADKKTGVRLDTGEIVSRETITIEERQLMLPAAKEGSKP